MANFALRDLHGNRAKLEISLFPQDDPKQTLRLKRFLMAALAYVLWVGITIYCYSLRLLNISGGWLSFWLATTFAVNAGWFVLIRTGWNKRLRDPSMTLPQMLVATFYVMLLMSLTSQVRGTMLMLFLVTFLFGVFRLHLRQYLTLTVAVLAGYAVIIAYDQSRGVGHLPLRLELLQFVILGVVLVWLSFFGNYVRRLRDTVARSNRELHDALNQIGELAVRDDLTGSYNRRHVMELLEEERQRAIRGGPVFSVCLLDIDNFKSVNDRYGHLVGDEVLKAFVNCIQEEVRLADKVSRDYRGGSFGRFGGEEFLLVLPDTTLTGAAQAADRLRRKVESTDILTSAGPLRLTVSIGVTEFRQTQEIRDTLHRADEAMYRAKSEGRNRVVSMLGGVEGQTAEAS